MKEREIPDHYNLGPFEAKEVIGAVLDYYDFELQPMPAYYLGSALKYLLRCTRKGECMEDIKKAHTFLGFILDE